jgi:hypothetical protein
VVNVYGSRNNSDISGITYGLSLYTATGVEEFVQAAAGSTPSGAAKGKDDVWIGVTVALKQSTEPAVESQSLVGTNGTTGPKPGNSSATLSLSETFDAPTDASRYRASLGCFNDLNNNGSQDSGESAVTPDEDNSLTVDKRVVCTFTNTLTAAATSISGVSGSGSYGGTGTLTATLTSGGNPVTGKTIDFRLNGTSVGTAITNSLGVATRSGVSLSGINAGTYSTAVSASFDSDGSYSESSGTGTLTVDHATATITFTASDLTQMYETTPRVVRSSTTPAGLSGVTVTYTGISGTSYPTSATAPTNAGSYSVSATLVNANYQLAAGSNPTTATLTVNKAPTTLTWMGPVIGTYGDYAFSYQVKLTVTATGAPFPGQTITFKGGTTTLGTLVTAADGKATLTAPLLLSAGPATITATCAATLNYQGASLPQPFTVLPAPAGPRPGQPLYTGTTWAWTTSSTSSAASLTLSATIQDLNACTADIRTAKVTFALRTTNGTYTAIQGATNLPVGLVNPADLSVGTANTIVQYNIGSAAAASLDIAVIVGGNYAYNNPASDTFVTIARPGVANSMMGGAGVNLLSFTSGTTYPIANGYLAASGTAVLDPTPNGYMQLSSYVTYTNKGTNPQGSITVQFNSRQAPDGVTNYSTYHRYLIKSTSISSLVSVGPGVLQFNAKAVLQDLTTGASIDGGATLQVNVTDGQFASGTGADKAGVTLYSSKNGSLWFSSSWGPTSSGQPPSTQQKPIISGSGNVAVQ